MNAWIYSLASAFIVSAVSLIGVFSISVNLEKLKTFVFYMISFSAGALLGDALIHLLPEAVEKNGFGLPVASSVLFGILAMFFVEKIIHWRHCHIPTSSAHPHPFAIINLLGDTAHNFIDGLIIGASYLINSHTGIATVVAIILHEIPQEVGDFSVLIHGGFSRRKAIFYNFITALTAFLGVVLSLVVGSSIERITLFLIPFAAGSFIYIACSDLIPEMHKEASLAKGMIQLLLIMLGMVVMFLLLLVG
jgi:zinc and cadmium transporter